MDDKRLRYIEHFLDCTDAVISGTKGAISEDKRLIFEYDYSYYPFLANHLKNVDQRVRMETVILLTRLKERQAADDIERLIVSDKDSVRAACYGYRRTIETDNASIPELMDMLRHRNGNEFIGAAAKMRNIARKEDLYDIREIYGQVQGEMRTAAGGILQAIVDRNPELRQKRYLIMSVPVYPNQEKFMKFIDDCIVYLDIRYRDNISTKTKIKIATYNNIVSAIRKMQIRLYNEKRNLIYYDKEAKQGYRDAEELIIWAADDLKTKDVIGSPEGSSVHECPSCGTRIIFANGGWICPECRK